MSDERHPEQFDYRASLKTGLQRLESEKLAFLGTGSVVSKFDPASIEAFSVPPDADPDDDEATINYTTELIPTLENSLDDMPNFEEDDLPGESLFRADRSQTPPNYSAQRSRIPSRPSTDRSQTPADYSADWRQTPADFSAQRSRMPSESSADWRQTPSESNAERNRITQEATVVARYGNYPSSTSSEPYVSFNISSLSLHDEERASTQELAPTQELSEARDHSETSEGEQSMTRDLTASAAEIRKAVNAEITRKAKVLKPATVRDTAKKPPSDSAFERLRNDGLFETLPFHPEVQRNLQEIQDDEETRNIDSLLPRSTMESYDGESIDLSVPFDEKDKAQYGEDPTTAFVRSNASAHAGSHDGLTVPYDLATASIVAGKGKAKGIPLQVADFTLGDNFESRKTIPSRHVEVKPTADALDIMQTIPSRNVDGESRKKPDLLDSLQTIPSRHVAVESHKNPDLLDSLQTIPAQSVRLPSKSKASPTVVFKTEPPSKRPFLIACICVLSLVAILLIVLLLSRDKDAVPTEPAEPTAAATNPEAPAAPAFDLAKIRTAVSGASTVAKAAFDTGIETWIANQMQTATDPKERANLLDLSLAFGGYREQTAQEFVDACIASGQFALAREELRHLMDASNRDAILAMRDRTFASDPVFMPEVSDMGETCDRIDPLGGGSTLTFKCVRDGEKVGAFKPLQTRRQSNFRSEIAAWRLCQMLECDFDIPWNRPVRIDHGTFETLYNRSTSSKKTSYRSGFGDLIWQKEDGKSWLYGTLKDWVPDFTMFPIEMSTLWKPWLSQKNFMETFPELANALAPIGRSANVSKLLPELLRQSPELTTKQLASQISQVLVFDFLTENWDRFSTSPSYWGVNCQFKNNRIVSIDNGASFPIFTNQKVAERFRMTERFSPRLIENLRGLDKERTLNLLFPEPSAEETKRFEIFWKHRTEVLERVDALVAQYTEEKVMSL